MEKILEQLKEDVKNYEDVHRKTPDYIIMGWDLVYEVRRMRDVYKSTINREYIMGIPMLETNITGVMALGTRCGSFNDASGSRALEGKDKANSSCR